MGDAAGKPLTDQGSCGWHGCDRPKNCHGAFPFTRERLKWQSGLMPTAKVAAWYGTPKPRITLILCER